MDLDAQKNHVDWNESYYFNFHDKKNDITALMRIGNKINKNEKSMFFYLMSPSMNAGIKFETTCNNQPLNIAGLDYKEINSGKWRLRYEGDISNILEQKPSTYKVDMDVTWEALNPLVDYKNCVDQRKAEISSNVASEHYEQFGKAYGNIRIDTKEFEIYALGERDFSRGIREWDSPKMWMWINAEFSQREAFNITKLRVEEGEVDAGYFHTGSVNKLLIRSDIEIGFKERIPSTLSMRLVDNKGSEYSVSGEIIRYGMIPVEGGMTLIEGICKYKWGEKEGYGVAEFLVPKN